MSDNKEKNSLSLESMLLSRCLLVCVRANFVPNAQLNLISAQINFFNVHEERKVQKVLIFSSLACREVLLEKKNASS